MRDTGVDVTLITPGWVRTPLTDVNEHPMPFRMELDEAVERMARAIRRREAAAAFPLPLALAVRVGRLLPRSVYDALAARLRRSKRVP
jgi:short-subunit dehydrogenase